MKRKILIVDDELSTCTFLSLALRQEYEVSYALSGAEGMRMLQQEAFDLVLLDLIIGEENGIGVLEQIKEFDPSIAVIMMTAFASIRTSVETMQKGAFTYLPKPLDLEELKAHITQAMAVRRLSEDKDYYEDAFRQQYKYSEMIGRSRSMQKVFSMIEKLKDVDSTVIITGESGTGKELVARAIHNRSKRSDSRFVVINCAAIPENLLEEELFGHKRGTFTGATQDKKGKFEMADGGTVFLDEIGDMPLSLQAKLLRVLQQKEVTPLGSADPRKVDVRILAATNRNLKEMVADRSFREDLYYRLNVFDISMPPLRERMEDIPLLCSYFIERFNQEQNKSVRGMTPQVEAILSDYHYPGNVRQLVNIIEHAMILCPDEVIGEDCLPLELRMKSAPHPSGDGPDLSQMRMDAIEKLAIARTLHRFGGKRQPTADSLGISLRSLQNKIKEYDL